MPSGRRVPPDLPAVAPRVHPPRPLQEEVLLVLRLHRGNRPRRRLSAINVTETAMSPVAIAMVGDIRSSTLAHRITLGIVQPPENPKRPVISVMEVVKSPVLPAVEMENARVCDRFDHGKA